MRSQITRVLAAFVLGCVLAPGSVGVASAATKVQVQLYANPLADNLAAFVAADQGMFAKHGLELSITVVPNIPATIAALVSGSGQIAVITPTNIVSAQEGGIPLVMIAGSQALPTPSKRGLIVRADSGIKTAKDLAGKKIGVPALGGQLHLALLAWLDARGADANSMTLLDVPFAQLSEVFRAGQADAVLTADPFFDRAVGNGFGVPLGDVYEVFPANTVISGYGALRPWIDANPDAVKGFRAALQDAYAFMQKDEKAAKASLQKWTKLPQAVVDNTPIPHLQVAIPDGEMADFNAIMKKVGFAKGTVDPSTLAITGPVQ